VGFHRARTLRAGNFAGTLILRRTAAASTVHAVDDDGFLSELAPVAAAQYERHVGASKEWFPHEMVPWSRGRDFAEGEEFDPAEANLSEAARSALLLNLLTEDNLPHYFHGIASRFGADDPWGQWNKRWTAEEGRHAIVIRDYLTVTRSIDLRELERARMLQVSTGVVPDPPSLADGIVYVTLQELATRIAHRNTGELLDDPVGTAIMRRVAADENLHHIFYREVSSAALELDPSTMVAAIERQVRSFAMPGVGIPDFKRHARLIANAGVYDFSSYYDQILVPVIFKHWRIDHLQNLKAAGEQARDRLMHHIERVGLAAKRMSDRLAARPAAVV
jgi:acyl-[acyl-carrier-protein] desaturase